MSKDLLILGHLVSRWELEREQKRGENDFFLGGSVSKFGLKPVNNTPFGYCFQQNFNKKKGSKSLIIILLGGKGNVKSFGQR